MRLLLGWVLFSAGSLAVAACSASDAERSYDGDSGEGGVPSGGRATSGGNAGKVSRGGKGGSGSSAAGTGSSSGGSASAGRDADGGGAAAAAAGAAGFGDAASGAGGDDPAGDAGSPGLAGSGGGVPAGEQCVAPCELALGSTDNLPGDSAVVVYDFETDTAMLTNDRVVSASSEWVIGFNYEPDPEYGYGVWSTGSWWFAYTEPLAYVDGTQGMQQFVEITSEMVNPATNQILLVVYSFGEHTVRVHSIGVPRCDDAPSGACASEDDCASVDAGLLRGPAQKCSGGCGGAGECVASCLAEGEDISSGCAGCYAEFLACVGASCPTECPGTGDNGCMRCETAHACHVAFMTCSGLGYMPRGTLTWPVAQAAL